MDVVDPSGRPVRVVHEVVSVVGDVVTLTGFLAGAGSEIEAQYGG